MIKAEGNLVEFVSRPIAGTLAVLTLLTWLWPLVQRRMSASSPSSSKAVP